MNFSNLKEKIVSIEQIKIGDLILVKPGEKIPVDGVIIDGETSIDESTITGESVYADKKKGDFVIGGTINKQGKIIIKAKKIGKETVLSQIIELVKKAQMSKPPIQKLVDLIASYFVPIVIFLSILTFVFWSLKVGINVGLLNSISVLIIACPCALGLATPIVLTLSLGKGANNGILIKDGSIFEIISKAKIIVFDKTGTITKGQIKVEKIIVNSNLKIKNDFEKYILNLAGSLEKFSEHPIGKAIYQYAKIKKFNVFNVDNFKAKTGFGVEGIINNKNIYVGKLIKEKDDFIEAVNFKNQGKTVVYVYEEKNLLGAIVIADEIKNEAKTVIDKLKKLDYDIYLISGDNKKTVLSVGEKIGIKKENIFYEILPQEKGKIIEKLKKESKKIIFVGDGTNDALALTKSDVGISLSSGTDIAIDSSQIILINNNLETIIKTINLSKKSLLIIKQNFFWAFFYNLILIPLAMIGKINPMLASLAMALSSLSVVFNSLRLKILKI
ncbi:MAG: heavy metal translocating P-type ATPase [Patescibacteria group bacterium]|nr:heavy metal translocating P-type ATPase [Patescibacteria group bacterium]